MGWYICSRCYGYKNSDDGCIEDPEHPLGLICSDCAAEMSRRKKMKWTKTVPTEPGWYWAKYCYFLKTMRFVVYIDDSLNTHYPEGYNITLLIDEWAGPIPEPEETE